VHQVWSDNTLQALPFMVTVTVLVPPASSNFRESGAIVKIWSGVTGSGEVTCLSLQELKDIAIIRKNKDIGKKLFISNLFSVFIYKEVFEENSSNTSLRKEDKLFFNNSTNNLNSVVFYFYNINTTF